MEYTETVKLECLRLAERILASGTSFAIAGNYEKQIPSVEEVIEGAGKLMKFITTPD